MSTTWSQGGPVAASRRGTNPPPVCFNCNQEGHFVVDCQKPSRLNAGAFPLPPANQPVYQDAGQSHQHYQNGPPQAQYPPHVQTQQHPQTGPYSYSQPQPPQSYNVPPPAQYPPQPGYQAPAPNQYHPQNGPPHGGPLYTSPGYQQQNHQHGPINTPYQPPLNNHPTNSGGGYGGNYGASAPNQQPQQSHQWNNATPVPRSAQPYQQPRRSASQNNRRASSTMPSQYSVKVIPQQEQAVVRRQNPQQTTQTPVAVSESHQPTLQKVQESPVVKVTESKVSSRASTPFGRRSSIIGLEQKDLKVESTPPSDIFQRIVQSEPKSPPPEDEAQQFNWDYKYIFQDPPKHEVVALAQPLSTTFDMTPVPQVDTRSTRSVSRYVRNDNLKEFVRSIRTAPQWSYLQEDPAFTDAELEGALIPIDELSAWIEKRQGLVPSQLQPSLDSKKRAWTEEQDEVDNQFGLDAIEDGERESYPNKRQKNDSIETSDEDMCDARAAEVLSAPPPGTPKLGTPVLGRSGTPCLASIEGDDAWAPQPGEGAAALKQVDPTEVLLAALGVTGSPKPVDDDPNRPYVVPLEDRVEIQPSVSAQRKVLVPPTKHVPPTQLQHGNHQGTPSNQPYQEKSRILVQPGSQSNHQNDVQAGAPNGPPNGSVYDSGRSFAPQPNQTHGPPQGASWSHGLPANAQYGSTPQVAPSQYGPTPPPTQNGLNPTPPMFNGNTSYGPPQTAAYPNPQYTPQQFNNGAPQNAHYGPTPQYGNAAPPSVQNHTPGPQYGAGPPSNIQPNVTQQYGHTQNQNVQYNGPPQYANAQPNVPNYGPIQQYGNGPASNMQSQGGPQYNNVPATNYPPQAGPHYVNGPPLNVQINGAPQYNNPPSGQYPGPSQFGPGPPQSAQHSAPQYQNNQYSGAPQQGPPQTVNVAQQQYPGPQRHPQYDNQHITHAPYGNAPPTEQQFNRGPTPNQHSYSNAPPRQDSGYVSGHEPYGNGPGPNFDEQARNAHNDGQYRAPVNGQPSNQTPKCQQKDPIAQSVEMVRVVSSSSGSGTPLSPTSAEILGKLFGCAEAPSKSDARSVLEEKTTRKTRKAQPVVAEAYSRRW